MNDEANCLFIHSHASFIVKIVKYRIIISGQQHKLIYSKFRYLLYRSNRYSNPKGDIGIRYPMFKMTCKWKRLEYILKRHN